MDISFQKKEVQALPTKKGINFIHDTRRENDIRAVIGFVIFLICLGFFTYFGVIRLLQKANAAEANYSQYESQIEELNNSMKDYDEVQAQYNNASGTFMTETELSSKDRMEIFSMIDQDIAVKIPLSDIHITGSDVEVTTGETTLDVVSSVLSTLQTDSRNSYATVTTTSAGNSSENDQVVADFKISYGTDDASVSENAAAGGKLTIANAPFIADKSTRKFHKAGCSELNDVDDFNKVPFRTAKDALAQGYVACDVCNPS